MKKLSSPVYRDIDLLKGGIKQFPFFNGKTHGFLNAIFKMPNIRAFMIVVGWILVHPFLFGI